MAEFAAAVAALQQFFSLWYVQAAILATSIYYQRSRQKKLEARAREAAEAAKGFQLSIEEPVSPIPVQYGRGKLGGVRVFHKTSGNYVYAAPAVGGEMFLSTGDSRVSTLTSTTVTRVRTSIFFPFPINDTLTFDETISAIASFSSDTITFTGPPGLNPFGYALGGSNANSSGFVGGGKRITITYTNLEGNVVEGTYNCRSYDNTTGVFQLWITVPQQTVRAPALNASISGTVNEFLFVQQAICHSGISALYWCDVDEKDFNDPKFVFGHRIYVYKDGDVADPMMTANGGLTTSVFTNTCYASMVFRLNREDPQYGQVPIVQFYIEGQKVKSITGSAGSRSLSVTKTYSNNPALCLLDYLTSTQYGKGLDVSKLDLDSFYNAYQICERVVETDRPLNGKLWNEKGRTVTRDIKLYECNMAIDTSQSIRDNIEQILETMPGAELVWSGGKYKLQLNYPTEWNSALSYSAGDIVQYPPGSSSSVDLFVSTVNLNVFIPVMGATVGPWVKASQAYITDADIVQEDEVSISYPNSQQRLNLATIKYLNESEDFAEDTVSWPTKYSTIHNTFLTQDGGVPLEVESFIPGVTDQYHALAIAEEKVRASRTVVVYKFIVLPQYADLEPGDIINVNSTILGTPGELLKIEEVKVNERGNAEIQAIKFDARQLAWNAKDDEVVAPRNIYNGDVAQVTGLAFSPTSEQTYTVGVLSWIAANDSRVIRYRIYYTLERPGSIGVYDEWIQIGMTSDTRFEIPSLPTRQYTLTVVAERSDGKFSPRMNYTTGSRWPELLVNLDEIPVPVDGVSPTTFLLTNEAHTVPTDSAGTVLTFAGADTYMRAIRGTADETNLWTYSKVDTGVVSTITDNHVVVTGFASDGDPLYASVKLLLHADDTLGSTSFLDNSGTPKTATNTSTNIVTTGTNAKYVRGINFPNVPDGNLSYADNIDWHFGAGNFAIDVQVYIATLPVVKTFVMGLWDGYAQPFYTNSWAVSINPSGAVSFDYVTTTEMFNNEFVTVTGTVTAGIVNYIRVTRNGANVDIRVNANTDSFSFAEGATAYLYDPDNIALLGSSSNSADNYMTDTGDTLTIDLSETLL